MFSFIFIGPLERLLTNACLNVCVMQSMAQSEEENIGEIDVNKYVFAPDDIRRLVVKPYHKPLGEDADAFKHWIAKLQLDEVGRIESEFEQLTNALSSHGMCTDVWKQHEQYNRYKDMVCFDDTRVKLQDGLQPDYIHANWINGFQRRNAYILTQGPLDNTITDMWRMIWQEKVVSIVMVTRLEEKGRTKCARYFPVDCDHSFVAGFFKIDLLKCEKRRLCLGSLMKVTNLLNKKIRYVFHVWYTSWPDQGVPDQTKELRHFQNYLRLGNAHLSMLTVQFNHDRGPPVVFHCSAGIGRSAALVALDIVTEGLCHKYFIDPLQLVVRMRKERYHAIHTKIQLLFLYNFVVDLAGVVRHNLLHGIE